jgi:tetratricopeptide (TPR) repeat protein
MRGGVPLRGRFASQRALALACIGASILLASCATTVRDTSPAPVHKASECSHCRDELAAAWTNRNSEAAYQALSTLIDQSPETLATLETGILAWIYNERAVHISGDELYRELSRLFSTYESAHATREPESLWLQLALLAAERGNLELAGRVIGHLTNPNFLIAVKADRLFDSIVEANPQAFEIRSALDRYIEDLRKQVEGRPKGLRIRLQLIDALLWANEFDEALQLSDDLAARMSQSSASAPSFDDPESALWILDSRAKALAGLGRREDAIEELERGRRPPGSQYAIADLTINLAALLCGFGRPEEALRVLEEPIWVSPFGMMNVHLLRHWAALQMRDAKGTATAMSYLEQHVRDDYSGVQVALAAAGRFDEAVMLLQYRLSNGSLRTGALMQLLRFDIRSMSPEGKRRELAWRAFADRPEVRAALAPYGDIEYFPIGPTQGWD